MIPYRSNSKSRPKFFPKKLYKTRARIEQAMGKLKRFKRIAMRCEKTATSYQAFVDFACSLILVTNQTRKYVTFLYHAAYRTSVAWKKARTLAG